MKAPFSPYLASLAPGLKQLIALLRRHFDYVSVLSTDSAGVIIQPSHKAGADGGLLRNEAVKLMQKGIPFVIIDSRPKDVPGCCVAFDDFKGAALAASYLAELGHKKFAMASCPQFSENGERRNGFESVIEEKGLGPLIEIEVGEGFEGRVCSAVRDGGATAVFAYNDEVAISVYRALAAEKISVPDDVSVVGYDDTLFAKAANPPLTSIVHPKEQLGRTAAEKLLSIITKTRYEIPKNAFEPTISVRGSCAPPKKQRRD